MIFKNRAVRLVLLAALAAAPAALVSSPAPSVSGPPAGDSAAEGGALRGDSTLSLAEAVRLGLAKGHVVRIEALGVPLARAALTEAWGRHDLRLTGGYTEALEETPLTPFVGDGLVRPFRAERSDASELGLEGLLPWGTAYRLGANTWKLANRGSRALNDDGTTGWAGVSITQPLLRDFGTAAFARVRVARTNLAISEWEFRAVLMSTVTRVVAACADFELAEARVAIARRSLDMALQLRRENARRHEVGAMSEYDVLSADARVASREETLQQAERGLDFARNTLLGLISDQGRSLVGGAALRLAALPLPGPLPMERAAALRQALACRPDYQQAQLLRRRGALEKGEALNQVLPRVDLVGSYGRRALAGDVAGVRDDLRSREHESWSAGVQVSIPLGAFAERGRHRAAALRLRQAEHRLEKMEQDIALEVANAAGQYETALLRVASAGRARQLNQLALEAEFKKLRAGTGSTFSVLYQQDQLNYAELTAAYARADLLRASADFDQVTGRTLEVHGVSPLR